MSTPTKQEIISVVRKLPMGYRLQVHSKNAGFKYYSPDELLAHIDREDAVGKQIIEICSYSLDFFKMVMKVRG